MANSIIDRLLRRIQKPEKRKSYLRYVASGSFIRLSDMRGTSGVSDIRNTIDTMRNLAKDSQISTALSYYATDCTVPNSSGQIIWATSENEKVAALINKLFLRWNINSYVRDHILELATVGNLYIPTTDMYKLDSGNVHAHGVALDNNTIPMSDFDIVPAYKIPAEDILHVWHQGEPKGYIYQPDERQKEYIDFPESAMIHFSLGGLLGDYTIDLTESDGSVDTYDIQFATPLMDGAVLPTQNLSLLEDSMLLASLIRVVKFINVDCANAEEEEIQDILQRIKDMIEQQMSLNTITGDAQSFLNPQSPNNLIYLPKVNGADAISITDLNMADNTEADNKLLDYYQNKKLSVLGIPKEAMNFSSAEGLGAAGTVMSQRSALYANILERLMTAYKNGWTKAINTYFQVRNLSGYVDSFELHMNPIVTTQSTIQFDKRDAALNQATTLIQLLKDAGVTEEKPYTNALIEILAEVFPKMAADATNWNLNVSEGAEGGGEVGI